MLSILIPVYQYDCTKLVQTMVQQAEQVSYPYELILGDDASDALFSTIYDQLSDSYPYVRVYRAQANMGAGRMRNALAYEARYEALLLLDSDVMPRDETFLQTHLTAYRSDTVLVGGFVYDPNDLDNHNRLRYIYGTKIEQRSLFDRIQHPYDQFVAMSLLIPRTIMLRIGFPDSMGMGYEDAAFGYRLEQAAIPIHHLNCPVVHSLKESSTDFIQTTRRYVSNLHQYQHEMPPGRIKLLILYRFILFVPGLRHLLSALWRKLHRCIERQLTSTRPSLKLFAFYKLLYLCSLPH